MEQFLNGFGQVIGVGGIIFFFTRVGLFGCSEIQLYRNDTKIGCFNRFFYDVAQFKFAGEDKTTECWSIKPVYFSTNSNLDRNIKKD